jgi:phosphohistidine phosphatase
MAIMILYFLRHGLAGDRDEWTGDDFKRPLTEEGKERMAREAATIARLGLDLDLILTSPLVRAYQTAEIVAQELNLVDKLVKDERLGLDFGPEKLALILQTYSIASALMLVGHEPSFSETIGDLIGGGSVECKKGSLARVNLPNPMSLQGDLVWLIPPKVLAL